MKEIDKLNSLHNILFAIMTMIAIFSIAFSDSFEKTVIIFVIYSISRFYFKFDEFVNSHKNRGN